MVVTSDLIIHNSLADALKGVYTLDKSMITLAEQTKTPANIICFPRDITIKKEILTRFKHWSSQLR